MRRDKLTRVWLHPPAPPVATAQTPVAATWPKQAAHPAVAAALMVQHLNLLVSFCRYIWADLLGFFPLKCSLQQRQCSACRGSWALPLFAFATRDSRLCFRLECSTIIKVFLLPSGLPGLKADIAEFGELVGTAPKWLMAPCQKGNLNLCVNMSTSELTLTIVGIAQICSTTRHGVDWRGMFCLCCVSFFSPQVLSRVTEIFFVNLYIGHWVWKLCYLQVIYKPFKNCKLDCNMALEFLKDKGVWEQQDLWQCLQTECSSPSLSVPCFKILMKNAWLLLKILR